MPRPNATPWWGATAGAVVLSAAVGMAAAGTATAQEGGFVLTGSWSFASGIKHSTHIHTLGLVEGTHEPRIFVLPVEKATLIENWDVLGLRATEPGVVVCLAR